jgi:hypothetical protein
VTFPANSSAAAIDTTSSSYNLGTKLKARTLVSTRFLVALALVVFHALLGTCSEVGAQIQDDQSLGVIYCVTACFTGELFCRVLRI